MSGDVQPIEQYDDIDGVPAPAMNDRLVGHETAFAQLTAAAAEDRLHHAWLFQGPRGIGKATAAFAFARRLLAGRGDAATRLATDRQIAGGGHPQLLHLTRPRSDKGTFRTQITVEEIRRLNHFFHTTVGSGWRVAIVDPADDLNRNAANALLKILEEPPARSVFLIVNHSAGRLLPTIRSRCRLLRFAPLSASEVERALTNGEGRRDDPGAVAAAAQLADGSVRTALTILESGGLEVAGVLETLMDSDEPDWISIQQLADSLGAKGREAAFAFMVADLFRLLAEAADARLRDGDVAQAAALARVWQEEQARWREAEAFNLDRRQTLLTFFERYRSARAHAGD